MHYKVIATIKETDVFDDYKSCLDTDVVSLVQNFAILSRDVVWQIKAPFTASVNAKVPLPTGIQTHRAVRAVSFSVSN